eukprot:1269841-Prymnesium_polylepis.4
MKHLNISRTFYTHREHRKTDRTAASTSTHITMRHRGLVEWLRYFDKLVSTSIETLTVLDVKQPAIRSPFAHGGRVVAIE